MITCRFLLVMACSATLAPFSMAHAEQAAATFCPPFSFLNSVNHANNPSFETVGENGNPSICDFPCTAPQESAADQWTIHSSNQRDKVITRLEPLSVLDPRREPFGTHPKAERQRSLVTKSN
jgi:hypothetical protein